MSQTIKEPDFLELLEILINPDIENSADLRPAIPAIMPNKVKARGNKNKTGYKLAVLLPDAQIGFRRYEDGTLDPFHDIKAISVALKIVSYLQNEYGVDVVINLGDTLDFPTFGKYAQEASFAMTTNETIQAGHNFLAAQRKVAPHAKIVFLEGNHDCRMDKYIRSQAPALSGVRQVGEEDYPVNSVPFLLRFKELGIEYVDGYPASKFWLNPRLVAVHGTKARSNGSTAYGYANANHMISTLFGHSHRNELLYKTHDTQDGPVLNAAFSPGCLCRVDGAVPSFNGGINVLEKPVTHYENWQQGVGVVWYKDEGDFAIEPIHIMDGHAIYSGLEFKA
jgi:predicted phosphodiesterase